VSDAVRAARAVLGARFRLHGRDPATGLDCVGLAALATGLEAPTGYALWSGDASAAAAWLDARLTRVGQAGPGDVMLLRSGPGQLHLAIRTETGFVHADAGLRRVVERPGAPPWPIVASWRA
jgi:murein DD-endopeptidase / murein LD-carboxypeptidase